MHVDDQPPPTDIDSTPFRAKTHSYTSYSSSEIINTTNNNYTSFWATRVFDNSRVFQDIEEFLEKFVPGDEPSINCPAGIFDDFQPDGSREDYVGMVCCGFNERIMLTVDRSIGNITEQAHGTFS